MVKPLAKVEEIIKAKKPWVKPILTKWVKAESVITLLPHVKNDISEPLSQPLSHTKDYLRTKRWRDRHKEEFNTSRRKV
jgi:hypothetical protein